MTTKFGHWVIAAAVAVLATGGGGCRPANRAQVSGRVTLDGQPVANGVIQFIPAGADLPTAGTSIRDGVYQVEASVGPSRVTVSAPKVVGQRKQDEMMETSPMIDVQKEQLSERYTSREKSELTVTLTAGKNEANFDLTTDSKKK